MKSLVLCTIPVVSLYSFFLVLCMCGYAIISHTVILKNTAGRKMELKSLILS